MSDELHFKMNLTPKDADNAQVNLNTFFGDALGEYYLTFNTPDCDYKGEGYVLVTEKEISFYDEKMAPVCVIKREELIYAVPQGFHSDDISMLFRNNGFVNAER